MAGMDFKKMASFCVYRQLYWIKEKPRQNPPSWANRFPVQDLNPGRP